MADVAKFAMHKDVASFEWPRRGRSGDWERNAATAFLAVVRRSVVGYLVTRLRSAWAVRDFDHPPEAREIPLEVHSERLPSFDLAFVCESFHHRGIALALMRYAAKHYGMAADEVVHLRPFTVEGEALAQRFGGSRLRVAGG